MYIWKTDWLNVCMYACMHVCLCRCLCMPIHECAQAKLDVTRPCWMRVLGWTAPWRWRGCAWSVPRSAPTAKDSSLSSLRQDHVCIQSYFLLPNCSMFVFAGTVSIPREALPARDRARKQRKDQLNPYRVSMFGQKICTAGSKFLLSLCSHVRGRQTGVSYQVLLAKWLTVGKS